MEGEEKPLKLKKIFNKSSWSFVTKSRMEAAAGSSPAGEPVVPDPPIWNRCPPFHVWPTGSCIHPILYFKNVPPPGFWPLLVFASPCCYILATGLSSRCISSKRQRSLKCVFNKFFSCHPDKLPGRDLGTVRAKTFQEKTTKICKIL